VDPKDSVLRGCEMLALGVWPTVLFPGVSLFPGGVAEEFQLFKSDRCFCIAAAELSFKREGHLFP
jgi:hypothetical protein